MLSPREPFKMHRASEVEKVKKSVKFKWSGPPPVIVSCSGNGGGGHEATLVRLCKHSLLLSLP